MNYLEKKNNDDEFELTNWDEELKGRRRLFVLLYCTDEYCFMNGTRAYKKAFTKIKDGVQVEPSEESAAQTASRLLQDEVIRKAISFLNRKSQNEDDEESARKMLRQMKTLSEFNTFDIIDTEGRLKVNKLEDLGELSKCIQGIVVKPGKYGTTYEVKLVDRTKAMENFAKYLELIRPENNNNVIVPVVMMPGKVSLEEEFTNA
jgi:phage terminase small subunit